MNQGLLCFTVAFLTVTGFLVLGCLGTYWLRNQFDAATRLQRTALIGAFTVLALNAIIAIVPAMRYPFLPSRPWFKEEISTAAESDRELRTRLPVFASEPAQAITTASAASEIVPAHPAASLQMPALAHVVWWLAGVWIAGSCVGLVSLLLGHLYLTRLRQRSHLVVTPELYAEVSHAAEDNAVQCPEVRLHPENQGPLLAGVFRPTLYIPVSLPDNPVLRHMLLRHELSHLVRRDIVFLIGSRVLCTLLWWHPLAHRLARQMEQTAEEACDACAAQGQLVQGAPEYARFLLESAKHRQCIVPTPLTVGICTPRSQVGKRIKRLLAGGVPDKPASTSIRIGMLTAALLLVGAGGVVQSSLSAPPTPDQKPRNTSAPGRNHTRNDNDVRLSFDVREAPLLQVLDQLFQQVGKAYKVGSGLDLTNVKVTANFSDESFFEALEKIREASPVSFAIRPSSSDSKIILLAPLPPHGMVTGRLVYHDGRPAVGYEIYADLWNQDHFLPHTEPNQGAMPNPDAEALYGERTLTDSAGRFTLRRLGNFHYNVSASLPDINHKSVPQDWVAPAVEGVRPRVDHTTDIGTIRLSRGGRVRGRVTDAKGKPLAKFYVGSHGPHRPETSGSVYPTETDAKGNYELRLPPGKSYVYIGMQHYRQEPISFVLREGETKTVNLVAKPER